MLGAKLVAALCAITVSGLLIGKSYLARERSPAQVAAVGAEQKAPPGPAREAAPAPPASPSRATGAPAAPRSRPLTGNKLASCLRSGRPTLANFGSALCHECQRQAPVLEQAAAKFQGKANVVYVSVDDYRELAAKYRVQTIPCQIFFDVEGKEVSRHVGFMSLEEITRALEQLGVK